MVGSNIFLRKRITKVFILFSVVFFLFVLRVGWIQLVKGDEFQEQALDNRLRKVKVEAKRGIIYDCNKTELAISISADYVYAIPPEVIRSGKGEIIAEKIAEILDISEEDVYKKITKKGSWFQYIKRRVDFDKSAKIKELDLPGISVAEESQRFYPNDQLAAHVLGFAGIDNQGLEGLEIMYDDVLKGENGAIMLEFDGQNKPLPNAVHRYIPPEDGHSIVLTIDETIQYIAERELDKLMTSPTNPKSATIIIMEPDTGKIKALASRPVYNPNNFSDYSSEVWRNIAVSNVYEPGSTFKIVTASSALEENIIKENERFYCNGFVKVGSEKIKCWRSHDPHGSQTFVEAVQNSCNPVFVTLGLRLREKEKGLFYDYIHSFGFGRKTGIDLPGEASGIMVSKDKLKDINVATISIGQGIAVTPIQMACAIAAVANGGSLMKPQLVEKVIDKSGRIIEEIKPAILKQVISQKTSQELREILEGVVSKGTGRNAYIEGYRVGGKTGTAQKPGKGGYQIGKYVASFLGLAPVDNPRLIGLVVVDEPQGYPYYGGTVAAPIFKCVIEDSLKYLNVQPQYNSTEINERKIEEIKVPDLRGISKDKAEKVLMSVGLNCKFIGEGSSVVDQAPKSSARVEKGTRVLVYLGINKENINSVKVPDVTGKRMKNTANLLEALGLNLIAEGSGYAVSQDPIPFEEVPIGTDVRVIFRENENIETLGP